MSIAAGAGAGSAAAGSAAAGSAAAGSAAGSAAAGAASGHPLRLPSARRPPRRSTLRRWRPPPPLPTAAAQSPRPPPPALRRRFRRSLAGDGGSVTSAACISRCRARALLGGGTRWRSACATRSVDEEEKPSSISNSISAKARSQPLPAQPPPPRAEAQGLPRRRRPRPPALDCDGRAWIAPPRMEEEDGLVDAAEGLLRELLTSSRSIRSCGASRCVDRLEGSCNGPVLWSASRAAAARGTRGTSRRGWRPARPRRRRPPPRPLAVVVVVGAAVAGRQTPPSHRLRRVALRHPGISDAREAYRRSLLLRHRRTPLHPTRRAVVMALARRRRRRRRRRRPRSPPSRRARRACAASWACMEARAVEVGQLERRLYRRARRHRVGVDSACDPGARPPARYRDVAAGARCLGYARAPRASRWSRSLYLAARDGCAGERPTARGIYQRGIWACRDVGRRHRLPVWTAWALLAAGRSDADACYLREARCRATRGARAHQRGRPQPRATPTPAARSSSRGRSTGCSSSAPHHLERSAICPCRRAHGLWWGSARGCCQRRDAASWARRRRSAPLDYAVPAARWAVLRGAAWQRCRSRRSAPNSLGVLAVGGCSLILDVRRCSRG